MFFIIYRINNKTATIEKKNILMICWLGRYQLGQDWRKPVFGVNLWPSKDQIIHSATDNIKILHVASLTSYFLFSNNNGTNQIALVRRMRSDSAPLVWCSYAQSQIFSHDNPIFNDLYH